MLSDEELRRLLATCVGRDFMARRDNAIVMRFLDGGLRLIGPFMRIAACRAVGAAGAGGQPTRRTGLSRDHSLPHPSDPVMPPERHQIRSRMMLASRMPPHGAVS